jgi:hypothetical protein
MLQVLIQQLSAEWQKPKAKNAKHGKPARDYKNINELHEQIAKLKK